jgi:hypothetical protein
MLVRLGKPWQRGGNRFWTGFRSNPTNAPQQRVYEKGPDMREPLVPKEAECLHKCAFPDHPSGVGSASDQCLSSSNKEFWIASFKSDPQVRPVTTGSAP